MSEIYISTATGEKAKISHKDYMAYVNSLIERSSNLKGNLDTGYSYKNKEEVTRDETWEDFLRRKAITNYSSYFRRSESEVRIKDVIFNGPATIVFWSDGTKTVVKAIDEPFDAEKGLAMAIAKKFFGNKGNYYNNIKKHLPKEAALNKKQNEIAAV